MTEKILIIDDDIDTLKLVGLMLERHGYRIAVASNGSIGLSKAASENPDLILLDIMMPDMDGYEVTRRLRVDPALAHIPIIMFTAKTMVDDKVAGFEAGVDDYLTKPTHPAELTAHVKAVLSRATAPQAELDEKAKVIGFIGARGGQGTTTVALNVGVAMQQSGLDVIVAELNPGCGSMALDLNIANPTGLARLLPRSLKDIHLRSVETELVGHKSGVRFLLASYLPQEIELEQAVSQMESVVNNLQAMCNTLVLDLGSSLRPYVKPILKMCDRVILILQPIYPTSVSARVVVEDIVNAGILRQHISMALVTRERTGLAIPWKQVEGDLGIELAGIISPAPEIAQQASRGGNPIVMMQPDSLVADQIHKLTDYIAINLSLNTR
jgi:pilus assembly protein CpaE